MCLLTVEFSSSRGVGWPLSASVSMSERTPSRNMQQCPCVWEYRTSNRKKGHDTCIHLNKRAHILRLMDWITSTSKKHDSLAKCTAMQTNQHSRPLSQKH
ncbi:hypothetical protein Y032_0005g2312 [Ancylostoma ceylanicum]|uniref:Uncharacterized protein n=1 Tax=Ancylostoma ceylanicum TaxID=53326 RepID=A0A016VR29_9BILA|nr:hypothetical protein Y032_0005g2312 [Ancylostoma ceylanicum]